jgi:thiamine biosynthesis protein ThiC
MCVTNFRPSEVKTSDKVKMFYQLMSEGKPYPFTWVDTLADHDKTTKQKAQEIQDMKRLHGNKQCTKCGRLCDVKQVQSNANGNKGKWYLKCPDHSTEDEDGRRHTWDWLQK